MRLQQEQLSVLCASENLPSTIAMRRIGSLASFLATAGYDGIEWGKSAWMGSVRLRQRALIGAIYQGEGVHAVPLQKVEKRQRQIGPGIPMIVDPTRLPKDGLYEPAKAPRFFRATTLLKNRPDWEFDWHETDQLRRAMDATRLNGVSLDTFYDRYPRTDNRGPAWGWQDAWEVLLREGFVGHVRVTIGHSAITKAVAPPKIRDAIEDWHVEKETWLVQLPTQNYRRTQLYHMLRMVGEHWRPPYVGAKLQVTTDLHGWPSPLAPISGQRTCRAHTALVQNLRQALLE